MVYLEVSAQDRYGLHERPCDALNDRQEVALRLAAPHNQSCAISSGQNAASLRTSAPMATEPG